MVLQNGKANQKPIALRLDDVIGLAKTEGGYEKNMVLLKMTVSQGPLLMISRKATMEINLQTFVDLLPLNRKKELYEIINSMRTLNELSFHQ